MTLQDRKIPIITGINDVPSTVGGENHPNASLLCKNYNNLIDDLLVTNVKVENNQVLAYPDDIYVATTGNDTTGNGSDTAPFATFDHAIKQARTFRKFPYLKILGNNQAYNVTVLDCRGFVPVLSQVYGYNDTNYYELGLNIENFTFNFNNTFTTDYNNVTTPFSNILGNKIYFNNCTFNLNGNDYFNLVETNCKFKNCIFNFNSSYDNSNSNIQTLVAIANSKIEFNNCTFNYSLDVADSFINAIYSDINLFFNTYSTPMIDFLAIMGNYNTLRVQETALPGIYCRQSNLLIRLFGTTTVEDFSLYQDNSIYIYQL